MATHDIPKQGRDVYFEEDDDSFQAARDRCFRECQIFNAIPIGAPDAQRAAAWLNIVDPEGTTAEGARGNLFAAPPTPRVRPPFHVSYGLRVDVAPTASIGGNCTILDTPVASVKIGEHVKVGPNVTLISVGHSKQVDESLKGLSFGNSITIGDWAKIGAGATILPGVTIGEHSIVGARSVVAQSVPAYCTVVDENLSRVIVGDAAEGLGLAEGLAEEPRLMALTSEEAQGLEPAAELQGLEDDIVQTRVGFQQSSQPSAMHRLLGRGKDWSRECGWRSVYMASQKRWRRLAVGSRRP